MAEEDLLTTVLGEYADEPQSGKSETEVRLEHSVLGRESDLEDVLNIAQKRRTFTEDLGPTDEPDADDIEAPAWQDDDDHDLVSVGADKRYKRFRLTDEKFLSAETLSKRMRSDYEKNLPTPAWATRKSNGITDTLSTSTGSYVDRKVEMLPLKGFQVKRLTKLNYESPAKGIVHALEFHPSAQVALVGSFGRTITLFQIDGKTNPKLLTVFFEKFPVSCAHFLSQGNEFLASSKLHPHMYTFDLLSEKTVRVPWNKAFGDQGFKYFCASPDATTLAFPARDGGLHILSGKSKEWLYSLKMNGSCSAVAFSGDSNYIYSIGDAGKVHVWDVTARKCLTTFMDDGCVGGTAIAASPNNEYLAVGSNTGVVNIYDESNILRGKHQPIKTVLNLTTSITALKFNPTSELLAMASNYTHGALKLLHLGELQVVSGFPEFNDKVRQAEIVDFSLNSGYMAVGNNKGEALLYRLSHYGTF